MARRRGQGEWQLYLRDHKWWWKWPLIATTVGVWVAAMVMFVAPWRSDSSIDDVETRPATTESDGDRTDSGDVSSPGIAIEMARPGNGVDDAATTIVEGDRPAEVRSLTPLPPASVGDATVAPEPTEASRPRSTGDAERPPPAVQPASIREPASSPVGPDLVTPTTTTRPTTTATTTATTVGPAVTTTPTTTPTAATTTPTTTAATEKPDKKPRGRDRIDDDADDDDAEDASDD